MNTERKDLHSNFEVASTQRQISPGAEKWLGEKIRVLDHGFVYLVDYMGNDAAVERAARVSYGRGTRSVTVNRRARSLFKASWAYNTL